MTDHSSPVLHRTITILSHHSPSILIMLALHHRNQSRTTLTRISRASFLQHLGIATKSCRQEACKIISKTNDIYRS